MWNSKQPILFSGTVRSNIIFGLEFQPRKYERVIKLACLKSELQNFSQGDQTVVGERGIMLSGGQKSRITLARALYSDADIYLLDDPLSAVDF